MILRNFERDISFRDALLPLHLDYMDYGQWQDEKDNGFPGRMMESCDLGYIHRPVKKLSKNSVDFINKNWNLALSLTVSKVPRTHWYQSSLQSVFRKRNMLWLNVLIKWVSSIVIHTWDFLYNFQFFISWIAHWRFS